MRTLLLPVMLLVLSTGAGLDRTSLDSVRPVDGDDAWLRAGRPDMKSAGPLVFTPNGILLVGDSRGSAVFALQVPEAGGPGFSAADTVGLTGIDEKIAARLGTTVHEIALNDMAVHPVSHAIYLSVQRGRGSGAVPAIIRIGAGGRVDVVSLANLRFAKAVLPNPPAAGMKDESGDDVSGYVITDLAIARGSVYVAGLTNDEFSSTLRRIPIPFSSSIASTGLRIYHTHHSRFETKSPITALVPYSTGGRDYIVASYACTPLALFNLDSLSDGARVTGSTIAELGAGTHATDLLTFEWKGERYLAVNTLGRSVQLLRADSLDMAPALTENDRPGHGPLSSWYSWGVPSYTGARSGLLRVAEFDSARVVALQRDVVSGSLNLRALGKPILW